MDVTSYLLGKKASGGSTPTLQSKDVTIAENGTQTITADAGYDGLSDVNVTTNVSGGADLSEYLTTEVPAMGAGSENRIPILKKSYEMTASTNCRSLSYAFSGHQNEIVLPTIVSLGIIYSFNNMFEECRNITNVDLSKINGSGANRFEKMFYYCNELQSVDLSTIVTERANNMSYMFAYCYRLTELDLTNFTATTELTNTSYMFRNCSGLKKIDMRTFTFDNVTSYMNYIDMFGGVPSDCEIIVKSETEKTWITDKFSRLTNVKTVEEYEAE